MGMVSQGSPAFNFAFSTLLMLLEKGHCASKAGVSPDPKSNTSTSGQSMPPHMVSTGESCGQAWRDLQGSHREGSCLQNPPGPCAQRSWAGLLQCRGPAAATEGQAGLLADGQGCGALQLSRA